MEITTIGLDIAKNVFQVHGVDQAGEVVIRKRLRRSRVVSFFEKQPGSLVGTGSGPDSPSTVKFATLPVAASGQPENLG